MEKRNKIIYWIGTGLLSAMVLMSAGMYVFNHEPIAEVFTKLGYPTYIIYPLAFAKLLGVIAILTKASDLLKNLAYAGFFFNFILAAVAHLAVGDGEQMGAIMAFVLLAVSFIYDRKVYVHLR